MGGKKSGRRYFSSGEKAALLVRLRSLHGLGMTMDQVALALGVSTATVSRWSVSEGIRWVGVRGVKRGSRIAKSGGSVVGYDGMKRLAAAILIPVCESAAGGDGDALELLRRPNSVLAACITVAGVGGSVGRLLERSVEMG